MRKRGKCASHGDCHQPCVGKAQRELVQGHPPCRGALGSTSIERMFTRQLLRFLLCQAEDRPETALVVAEGPGEPAAAAPCSGRVSSPLAPVLLLEQRSFFSPLVTPIAAVCPSWRAANAPAFRCGLMHFQAFPRLICLSSRSSHPGVGIYLGAAPTRSLQTLAARSGMGWGLSRLFVQINMWDKDFACTGSPEREQEPHREPSAGNKGAFQRGTGCSGTCRDAGDSGYLCRWQKLLTGRFPLLFSAQRKVLRRYIKIPTAKPSPERGHVLGFLQTFPRASQNPCSS